VEEDHPATGKDRVGGSANEQGASGWVTTKAAARTLGVTQRTVRTYIGRGKLQAKAEGEGRQKTYLVSVDSVHALRERQGPPQKHPDEESFEEAPDTPEAVPARDFTGLIRDLTGELVQKASEAAELKTRLQLTEQAESTLQEQLQRERERAERLEAERDRLFPDLLREKDRANAERERAEHFEDELRKALEARRGWFRRFFGF
jgi:DNA-binding transcriptional MerR regulator